MPAKMTELTVRVTPHVGAVIEIIRGLFFAGEGATVSASPNADTLSVATTDMMDGNQASRQR
jgi:hypothetical protein